MDVRLAAIQYRPPKGAPDSARGDLEALLHRAGAAGAALAVAPEMATTGYVWPHPALIAPHCEPADGPTAARLGRVARKHRMWVVCGFAEDGGDAYYNSAMVIDHDGQLAGVYRKVDLFDLDTFWATPGDTAFAVDTPFGPLAVGICRDLVEDRYPLWLKENQPSVLAFCAAWVPCGEDVHAYWLERLAPFNGVTVAANGWGVDMGVPCSGGSAILSSAGVLASGPAEGDALVIADLSLR